MAASVPRYLSLDFLRGVSVFGMVLSAIQPHGVMPAWMYHVQNPPPSHTLNVDVAGIGWVDLVFPVFIFCMGIAIPFAARRPKEVVGRFFMLWLFSYLYVLINSTCSWVTLAGFLAMFPLYMNVRPPMKIFGYNAGVGCVRWFGVVAVLGVVAVNHFFFGEVVNVHRRGIIIFLLAFLYLFGSLVWYYTQEKYLCRFMIWVGILAFTAVTQILDLPSITYSNPNIRWWFNMEYIYFLLILVPATYLGDLLKNGSAGFSVGKNGRHTLLLCLLSFALVVWMTFAFYMRLYWLNPVLSGALLCAIWLLVKRHFPGCLHILKVVVPLVIAGELLDPCMGGIKKVPCTIPYCFATCGMAAMLLVVSDYICSRFSGSLFVRLFAGAGKNPLMSYVAFDCLVFPLMKISGAVYLYKIAYPQGMPLLGFARAVFATLLTMCAVGVFTSRKIFWKA